MLLEEYNEYITKKNIIVRSVDMKWLGYNVENDRYGILENDL